MSIVKVQKYHRRKFYGIGKYGTIGLYVQIHNDIELFLCTNDYI